MEITFAVNGSNSFHKLEPAKAMLRFCEFDFTYFWEQCIEVGRNARKTGRISANMVNVALGALAKCHPYVNACIQTEFSSVVLDCIIAYICHSEGIGLEELWVRCISPKSLYEKDIFRRVSDYKTGRGINQWINIVRMQEYARSKMSFIYECDDNVMISRKEYRTRREYFDLAFLVAANETGCPMRELPSVKKYSPSLLPDGAFMLGRVSKNVYRRLSDVLSGAERFEERHLNDHNRDRTALDAFSYVKDMPRPGDLDMSFAVEAMSAIPEEVYVPDSFKAMIDLEFTVMYEEDIYLSKCPRCEKFFIRELGEKSPYCNRVNSSGTTCANMVNEELGIAAMKQSEKPRDNDKDRRHDIDIPDENKPKDENLTEEKPEEQTFRELPIELERRCQKVYGLLYKRAGRIMSDREFREWSGYLSDMKRNFREGNAEAEQIDEFLDYWENAAKSYAGKASRFVKPKPMSAPVPEAYAAAIAAVNNAPLPEPELIPAPEFDSGEENFEEQSGISPAGTETLPEERDFKPFNPPKYNTVLEAMMDGKYKSDELLSMSGGSAPEDLSEIKVKGRKIRLPEWERVTREDSEK